MSSLDVPSSQRAGATEARHLTPLARFGRPRKTIGRFIQGSGFGLADQSFVSGINFATTVLLARVLSPADFGSFTLAYLGLLFAASLQSALITQPHNVIAAAATGKTYVEYTSSAAVAQALLTSLLALLVGTGWMLSGAKAETSQVVVGFLLAVGAWQLQEFARRILYTEGRFAAAFLNDLITYGGRGLVFVVLATAGLLDAASAMYAIAIAAAVAAILGLLQLRDSLARGASLAPIKESFVFGKWLVAGEIGYWLSTQIYFYLAASLLGLAEVGVVRAAQILLGPLQVLSFYLYAVLPVRFSKSLAEQGPEALSHEVAFVRKITAVIAMSYCLPIALLGPWIVRQVFGDAYYADAPLFALLALGGVAWTLVPAWASALRAVRSPRDIFIAFAWASGISLSVGWFIVRFLGADGVLLGIGVSGLVVSAFCWVSFRRWHRSKQLIRSAEPSVSRESAS